MYFHSVVYTMHIYASDVKSAHTQVFFGDVKFVAKEGKVEGIVKVWVKFEPYDHIGIA